MIRLNIVLLVGAQERLPVRLVALRLPAPLAAQRRRRARANARRDRALRLTKRYLKLLDWTILLTNVTPSQLSAQRTRNDFDPISRAGLRCPSGHIALNCLTQG